MNESINAGGKEYGMKDCSIMILGTEEAAWRQILADRLPSGCHLICELDQAQILIGCPAELAAALPEAKNLIWAQSTFAGVDALMKDGLRRDYRLSRVTGIFGPAMAEWAFAHIIARERGFQDLRMAQSQQCWEPRSYRMLSQLHVGLVGLGEIGGFLLQTAQHFGMRCSAYRREGASAPPGCSSHTDFATFLSEPDYFIFTLPDTASTRGLINERSLACMKQGAVLINAGRGSLIDEAALAAALHSRHLGGAILDVFAHEPLAPESPLWQAPGCVISPHCSALSFPHQVAELFLENLALYRQGMPLRGEVNFTKGY